MSSSEAVVVDIVPEPRATKRGKSKEPRTLARESVLLDDCVGVLEDSAARAEERYSDLSQHVEMLEEGFHLMEKDIVAAIATFRHRLEQFKMNLARHNDERGARDMMLQDIGAQVKEIEDLKTREALLERIESDQGEPPKTSEAKGGGEHRDPGDAKGRNESSTLTALQLCDEVKRGKAKELEEEDLSGGETVKSLAALKLSAPNQGTNNRSVKQVFEGHSGAWRSEHACRGGHAHSGRSVAWQNARACRGGHAHLTNSSHSELAGALAQRGKTLGAGAGTDADIGSKARGRLRANARRTARKAMRIKSDSARDEGVCALGGGECHGQNVSR